jgi:hypothetical protein
VYREYQRDRRGREGGGGEEESASANLDSVYKRHFHANDHFMHRVAVDRATGPFFRGFDYLGGRGEKLQDKLRKRKKTKKKTRANLEKG